MWRVTQHLRTAALLLLLSFVLPGTIGAAMADAPLLAQATQPSNVTNVSSGRSYTFEIGIVVVMFGGAVFAVCRSSNRA